MLVTVDENILQEPELNQYYTPMQTVQSWLLDEVEDTEAVEACKAVLTLLKAGTKAKRKKYVKAYFELFDEEQLKQAASLMAEGIKNNLTNGEELKNQLVSLDMLIFTKRYLEDFTSFAPKVEEPSPYTLWLQKHHNQLLAPLENEYESDVVSDSLVRKFTRAFRKFYGTKLVLRVTEVTTKAVSGIPLELTESGYREMQHPFLPIEWELSAPAENMPFEVGDLIEAYYNESRNEYYRHLLLYVDFRNAVLLNNSLTDLLQTVLKPAPAKNILAQLPLPAEEQLLEEYIITKLVERAAPLKQQLESALSDVNNQLVDLEQKQQAVIQEIEKSKQWQRIIERIDYFKALEQFEGNTKVEEHQLLDYEQDAFIEKLQSLFYYNDEQELIYPKDIIRSFVQALQANVLTVLAGPSGTGKSSIVHAFARAVKNVEVRMVPVQSSWTDTQDLLGYFHPTDKAFVPTPFMEALAEAAQPENANKIFLICLDEMNLAHVEYYFSEILSAREDKKQQIRLYPKRHWETAKLILDEGKADAERLQSAAELVQYYPPVFTIPSNVRFIGTLNMDHTVKPLSPKVIDRSFIIEINHLKTSDKKAIIASLENITGKIKMDYATFVETQVTEVLVEEYIQALQTISTLFEDYPNASLNSRGIKHLTQMLLYSSLDEQMDELMDRLVYGKILPRLEIKKTDIVQQENAVLNHFMPYPKSREKLQKMLDTKHTITFW